jgi:hypothetical protein
MLKRILLRLAGDAGVMMIAEVMGPHVAIVHGKALLHLAPAEI